MLKAREAGQSEGIVVYRAQCPPHHVTYRYSYINACGKLDITNSNKENIDPRLFKEGVASANILVGALIKDGVLSLIATNSLPINSTGMPGILTTSPANPLIILKRKKLGRKYQDKREEVLNKDLYTLIRKYDLQRDRENRVYKREKRSLVTILHSYIYSYTSAINAIIPIKLSAVNINRELS